MKRPLFSCVVPVKGPRPYFDTALESLHNQGLGSDLDIIIQDGDVESDQGQSDALNKGFAKAKGEWLFWLNADDVLLPGVLQRVKTAIHSTTTTPRIAPAAQLASLGGYSNFDSPQWIAGNTVYIDKDGRGLDARWNKRWHPVLYKHMPVWTGGPSAFFRRELFENVGGFDTSLKYVMDIDLWTRMARAGAKYEVVDFPVWGFRWHKGSLTAGGQHEAEHIRERVRMCEKFGLWHQTFWRNMLRVAQLADGSYRRRVRETKVVRGRDWREMGVML